MQFKKGICQWYRIFRRTVAKNSTCTDMYTNAQVEFLDEPTAALDAKSENEIYQHF